ncbi:MAG: hypothetical protein M0C28_24515 [Candidatus Moduliflexus flocculans]|nr:hypothetical protein [Candidatus Moduliflexus flocculans]
MIASASKRRGSEASARPPSSAGLDLVHGPDRGSSLLALRRRSCWA